MQKVVYGIKEIIDIVNGFGCRKLLLVAGSSFYSLPIKDDIARIDAEFVDFSGFTPNPLYEQILEGVELFKKEQCDGVIAVGGGSAIDVAKCIKLSMICKEGTDALIPPLVSVQVDPVANLPLIAIPTTAGSGSESTHNAVIYYEGNKQTVVNDAILPDVAVLEPSVLINLPVYQKKCTMMDAFCQAIESWWSVNSNNESKEYSKKAIELIVANWESYIFNNDKEAMKQIMIASNYSGKAINIAQTTAAHAMSYKITSLYKIPHGYAVALCLQEIWEYMTENMDKCSDVRGEGYLMDVFRQIAGAMGQDSVDDAIAYFRKMVSDMGLTNPVDECRDKNLPILASSVNTLRLKNNPVTINQEAVSKLYQSILA